MAEFRASYAVHGGGYAEGTIPDGLSPNEMAEAVYEEHPGISLCHQCGSDISDPEVEAVTSFTINGVEYVQDDDGDWWPSR